MVSVAVLREALGGTWCETEVACIVSYEGFADRGLGGLPGGEQSELVKGVRACSEAVRSGYGMVPDDEKTGEATLERELSDARLFSKSPRRASWFS